MKNLFNIIGFCLLSLLIICCGEEKDNNSNDVKEFVEIDKDNQVENLIMSYLKETPLFYAKTKEFNCIKDKIGNFSITNIIMSSKMAVDPPRQRLSDEILKTLISNGNSEEISFKSTEESRSTEGLNTEGLRVEYRLMQKGEINIGENKFIADFYFNGEADERTQFFHGRIIFSIPSIKSLNGGKVIIEVKGKK